MILESNSNNVRSISLLQGVLRLNILITGGAGYIGSNIYLALFKNGFNPIIVDNFSESAESRITELEKLTEHEVSYANCDIADIEDMTDILNDWKIDAVVHAAGFKTVSESVNEPLKYYKNNVAGIINLLIAMRHADVKKIVFSSSASVYGNPKELPVTEEAPTNPVSPYGRSKLQCENIIRDTVSANSGWSAISLRYFNPIGKDKSGLLDDFSNGNINNLYDALKEVLNGNLDHLNIFGKDYDTIDGTAVRDFIHITDLANGHVSALNAVLNSENHYDTFNLGCGNGVSILELKSMFEEKFQKKIPFEFQPNRPGDIAVNYADISKAQRILKWSPELQLDGSKIQI
ncbi:UDP-glucose 4-epimerase GalE [Lactobacillus salsicarnum]|uniref:UDP-glucose 4-epimerase n=1 Tax=Companilactobacillus mishanensis TaxID=2486008 RepID=A0A5P0ZKA0_9LACO|nr:UDP-glucose 4-epimerase GalE [Companilactobacillus mishanensis]MQS53472.1 UDP-glucose 4-epimerase GalE [Companilactobacillus mishanensis]